MKKVIKAVKEGIRLAFEAVGVVFREKFGAGSRVISSDVLKILSHPEDRKKYVEAIRLLKSGKVKEVDLTFSSGKRMILTFGF